MHEVTILFLPITASIGFTRRAGNTRLVHPSLTHLLQQFPSILPTPKQLPVSTPGAAEQGLALVFGREESGLTEKELSLCTHSCSIPTGARQPSLNLSHAVCVILAQLYERRTECTSAGEELIAFTTRLINQVCLINLCDQSGLFGQSV